jgi:DNA invertase Pin-like site-specific DNA recombinase
MVFGYLRGSNGEIDKSNQQKSIENYAKENHLSVIFTDDTVSSGEPYYKRKIKDIVDNLREKDILIVAELSRLARNLEESLTISREIIERKASLIILNPALEIKADNDLMAKMMFSVMSMSAEIERYYIKSRTKISLQHRKELIKTQGFFINKKGEKVFQLGNKKGSKYNLKLESKKNEILKLRKTGLSHQKIATLYNVNRATVANFLKRYEKELE